MDWNIWNVSFLSKGSIKGYQIEAENITDAVKKAQKKFDGEILKIALADYENAD